MEGYRVSLVVEHLTNLEAWWVGVVPHSDGLINTASSDQLLLDADVHAVDGSGVEWENQVFILNFVVGSLKVHIDFHDLVVISGEHNDIISGTESKALDSRRNDSSHKLGKVFVLLVSGGWEGSHSVVWVLWLLGFLINDHLSVVTSNDETLAVGLNALDIEVLTWGLLKEGSVFSI
jgi:hypothetical protein